MLEDRKSTRLNSSHTEIYTLSLHDALPISTTPSTTPASSGGRSIALSRSATTSATGPRRARDARRSEEHTSELQSHRDLHSFPTRRSSDLDYTVNNSGVIRWPFNSAVPLGDHFGYRPAPCKGCSTFHKGTDFETGDGAPIYAVAAGVVTISELSGSLGQHKIGRAHV